MFTLQSHPKTSFNSTERAEPSALRALFKLDVSYQAIASAETLRPIETQQTESYRSKKIVTHLTFTNNGVTRARTEGKGAAEAKTRQFNFPNLFDLFSAMLYLRSQPLKDRSVYRVVAYPATNAYLATVTVVGREKSQCTLGVTAQSNLICSSNGLASIANWSHTGNFAAPRSGCQMMPNDCCFALKRKSSSAQSLPKCNRSASTIPNNACVPRAATSYKFAGCHSGTHSPRTGGPGGPRQRLCAGS